MKKSFYNKCLQVIALFILAVFPSCGDNKNSEKAPEGMIMIDLNRYGKSFSIYVPDTSVSKLEITEQSSGALEVRSGKNFAISIFEQPADIALRKSDIRADDVNKLKQFIRDEPAAIVWESEITKPEFHFLMNKKLGAVECAFEDVQDAENGTYSKDAVEKMFQSCVQATEKKK